jgi:aminoglycoside phosphotransferase (APT) family kinase protein
LATTPSTPRPRTGSRDPEQLHDRLAAWIADREPGAAVTGLTVPQSNGMSSETVLFDLRHADGAIQPCVLRLAADPGAFTVFPRYDMERQYRCMELIAAHTKAPVPRPLGLEPDPAPLGAPAILMERIDGRVPPDAMPYTYGGNWLHEASDTERAGLERASVALLAELHTAPLAQAGFLRSPDAAGRRAAAARGRATRLLRLGGARPPGVTADRARLRRPGATLAR